MSDLEQRLRRAFKILFDDRDRMQKEIAEIKARLEEIEQRLGDLYRIGKN
jgi:polyhydroxyalkanoate synthesis regulator phasin